MVDTRHLRVCVSCDVKGPGNNRGNGSLVTFNSRALSGVCLAFCYSLLSSRLQALSPSFLLHPLSLPLSLMFLFFLSLLSLLCQVVCLSSLCKSSRACKMFCFPATPSHHLTFIDSVPILFAKHFQRGFPLADLCIKVYAK